MDGKTPATRRVVGGVDTHKDLHVAAVVDELDRLSTAAASPTTRQGYRQMLAWMRSFGHLQRVGVESTGSYGAGLAALPRGRRRRGSRGHGTGPSRSPQARQERRPRRPERRPCRLRGTADRHAQKSGRHGRIAQSSQGLPEDCSERTADRPADDPQHDHRAPEGLARPASADDADATVRTLAAWRPDLTAYRDIEAAYRICLKSLARRYLELHDEIADLDMMIGAIVLDLAPDLVAPNSIGHNSAAQLLLTAGDNPERLKSEASFAALCGVSPVPASSGKTVRHRLNRGGDRAANSALHIIAVGRLRTDERTKAYVARRVAEGHSKLEAIRASNATSPARSSASSCAVRRRSTRPASPLDKQKGVQGSQFTSSSTSSRCRRTQRSPSAWTAKALGATMSLSNGSGGR